MGVRVIGNHSAAACARRGLGRAAVAAPYLALILLLAAAPQEARAGACSKAGQKPECVNGTDVQDGSLTAFDMKDEAGASFVVGTDELVGANVWEAVAASLAIEIECGIRGRRVRRVLAW